MRRGASVSLPVPIPPSLANARPLRASCWAHNELSYAKHASLVLLEYMPIFKIHY